MSRRRILGASGAVLGLLTIVFAWLTYAWFLSPAVDEPQQADAVIMHGGGRGERLAVALDLIDQDLAPVLVLVNGLQWSKGIDLCLSEDQPVEIVCPGNVPNTRGEAREIQALAEERAWDTIILVTSDYHITRASNLVGRCFDGTIYRVAAENQFPLRREVHAIAREWAGTGRNLVFRDC
ncbi:MAG: YdcF family protein [Actinomycetota bacterium]